MIISATQEKIDKTLDIIKQILQLKTIPIKLLASASGSIIALHPAYGDIVYLKSKRIAMSIAEDEDWTRHITINRQELLFWTNYLPHNNGRKIHQPLGCAAVSYSDASATGCASIITPCPSQRRIINHREFSEPEQKTSSTYRELLTVHYGLSQAKHLLENQSLRWFTDATNVVLIIRKGSMKPHLQNLAIKIFQITHRYNINLCMTWLRRNENCEADEFSRVIEHDDWGIHPSWFAHICSKFGAVTVDRFADPFNTKTQRFNSRFYWPQAEAVDAFTQNWHNDNNWLVPPLFLIVRTIRYLKACSAKGILVVPVWKSAHYWPEILNLLENDKQNVKGTLTLGDIFTHYRNTNSLFGSSCWKSETLVLKLDYKQ